MRYITLAILLIVALVVPVLADNTTQIFETDANGTESIVTYHDPILYTSGWKDPAIGFNLTGNYSAYDPKNATRISPGDCVQLGDTVDISGIGWYTGAIVTYGRYFNDYGATTNESMLKRYLISPWNLTHVYIDPAIFDDYPGWWYVDYAYGGLDITRNHGYDRLFYVSSSCYSPQKVSQQVQAAFNESQANAAKIANLTSLTYRGIDGIDYIVSRNVTTTLDVTPGYTQRWLFGIDTSSKLYDTPVLYNGTTLNAEDTINLLAGRYDAFFISAGHNGVLEENYDAGSESITSPFKGSADISTKGIQPRLVENLLSTKIHNSLDDRYSVWKIALQDPSIEVVKIDQTMLLNNNSAFALAGYTNMNQGDTLTIVMDADKPTLKTAKPIYATVVDNGGQSGYRSWNTSFIVDMNGMAAPAYHSFTVTSNEGAKAVASFYLRKELAAHYQPEKYLSYIDNNPFIPTPTPITVVRVDVQKQIVVQTVTVPVTPSQESVNEAQYQALLNLLGWVAAVLVVVGLVVYLLIAIIRSQMRK